MLWPNGLTAIYPRRGFRGSWAESRDVPEFVEAIRRDHWPPSGPVTMNIWLASIFAQVLGAPCCVQDYMTNGKRAPLPILLSAASNFNGTISTISTGPGTFILMPQTYGFNRKSRPRSLTWPHIPTKTALRKNDSSSFYRIMFAAALVCLCCSVTPAIYLMRIYAQHL